VYPGGAEWLYAVDDLPHGPLVGEDADAPVLLHHSVREVFGHHRRLVALLEVEVSRKETACRFLEDHHRVPVVHVRSLEETQRVPTQVERQSVLDAAHPVDHPEVDRVEADRKRGADELRSRRVGHEADHAAVLVPLPVAEDEEREGRRIPHLADSARIASKSP